jgi:hypothetical protein
MARDPASLTPETTLRPPAGLAADATVGEVLGYGGTLLAYGGDHLGYD